MGHLRERRRLRIDFIRLSAAAFGPALLNLSPFCGDPPKSCFDVHTPVSQSVTRSSKRKGTTIANKKGVLACGYCQKSFSFKSVLNVHLRTHTGEKPYSCDVCKRSFAQLGILKNHLRVHQAKKDFCCDYCGQRFSRNDTLVVHRRIHTGEKLYSCDVCKRSFAQAGTLTNHLKVHQAKKLSGCKYCGKLLSTKDGLIKHVRTHTGEKPYECPECGRCFAAASGLNNHLRVHSGVKPYKCSECSRCFAELNNLKRHLVIHLKVKPYECLICGKGFTRAPAVQSHLQKQHEASPLQYKRLQTGERLNTVTSTPSNVKIGNSAFQIRSTPADGGDRNVEFSRSVPVQVDETQSVGSLEVSRLSRKLQNRKFSLAEKKLVCTFCGERYKVRSHLKNHLENVHHLESEATENDTVKTASGCVLAEHGSQNRIAPRAGGQSLSSNVTMHPGTREQDHSNTVVTSWDDSVIGVSGSALSNVGIENHLNRTIRSDSAEHDHQIRAGEGPSHLSDQRLDEGGKPSDKLPDIVTDALPLLENHEVSESLVGVVTNLSLDPNISTRSASSEDAQSPVVLNRTSPGLSHLDGEHLDEDSTPALFVEVLKLMEAKKIFELLGVETPNVGANGAI